MTPDLVFRDPYILDFLRLKDTYSEDDLESAILREMEQFLLELGVGFSFVARQYRMVIGNEDFYLDLLFFHRKLHRLIAIELKIGHFKAAYKGQMELYLRWLEEHGNDWRCRVRSHDKRPDNFLVGPTRPSETRGLAGSPRNGPALNRSSHAV